MASSKLTAKAARLDFSSLPGAALTPLPAPDPMSRPKTAPGAMMAFANDARSELMRENEQLRGRAAEAEQLRGQLSDALADLQQWDGAKAARLIDAKLIDASRFANRHERNYGGADFALLRAEIDAAGGNVQPIKVRRVADGEGEGSPPRYELVFGHRRHRACLELGLPVLAVIDNLDDRALFVEMDRENRARKDLSAWEQGMMYRRALQLGLFPSNRKLSEAIGVDLSALGKALALADLPEALVQAFASPLDLQFRWARPLAAALASRPEAVLSAARLLSQGPADRPARQVYDHLLAAAAGGVEPFHPPGPVPVVVQGVRVGTVSCGPRGEITLTLLPGQVAAERMVAFAGMVEEWLGLPPAGDNAPAGHRPR